jgi:predicted DNA-binding protein with PD1-like motif
MRVSAAEPGREIAVILEAGDELRRALQDLCLERNAAGALFSGSGRLRDITFRRPRGMPERIREPMELVHLSGTAERSGKQLLLDARAVVLGDGEAAALAGGVVSDATFERGVLRLAVLATPLEPVTVSPEPRPESSPPAAADWGAVAAASADKARLGPPDDERPPRPGDLVDHPTFGRLKIVGIDDEHLKVRREGERTMQLGLSRVQLELAGQMSDGTRVFKLSVQKRS